MLPAAASHGRRSFFIRASIACSKPIFPPHHQPSHSFALYFTLLFVFLLHPFHSFPISVDTDHYIPLTFPIESSTLAVCFLVIHQVNQSTDFDSQTSNINTIPTVLPEILNILKPIFIQKSFNFNPIFRSTTSKCVSQTPPS